MEATPPSYNQATTTDHWALVSYHVPRKDLCSATLVSRSWHATFAPLLWGNPTSHFEFGDDQDSGIRALARFRRTLSLARLCVRALTHTLHLPPAHEEQYDGVHAGWLRDMLDNLPNLQSLIVSGLSFFNHSALVALKQAPARQSIPLRTLTGALRSRNHSDRLSSQPFDLSRSFGLRLLDASDCPNVHASSLADALGRFEGLLYLDLSNTPSARDTAVLESLRRLRGLQILKLQSIGLDDTALGVLVSAIGRRVRSLDLSDNAITDHGTRMLVEGCFIHSSEGIEYDRPASRCLPGLTNKAIGTMQIHCDQRLESYIRGIFTRSFVDRLVIEDIAESGLTHLYIAKNRISSNGIGTLLKPGQLFVLDAGHICDRSMDNFETTLQSKNEGKHPNSEAIGLSNALAECAYNPLKFLRIHHSMVCKPEWRTIATVSHHMLDENRPLINKSSSSIVADPIHSLCSDDATLSQARTISDSEDQLRSNGQSSTETSSPNPRHDQSSAMYIDLPPQPDDLIQRERRGRIKAHMTNSSNIHPAMMPQLRTLVLTDIPQFTTDDSLSDNLIGLLKQCADEANIALEHAKHDYALPPGTKEHCPAFEQAVRSSFALERIVLEFPLIPRPKMVASGNNTIETINHLYRDNALAALEDKVFSMFRDVQLALPTAEASGIEDDPSADEAIKSEYSLLRPRLTMDAQSVPKHTKVDTIARLVSFRQDRKATFLRDEKSGVQNPTTEGYWKGVVVVKRFPP